MADNKMAKRIKYKRTNNDLHRKYRPSHTENGGLNSGAPDEYAVPAPYVLAC